MPNYYPTYSYPYPATYTPVAYPQSYNQPPQQQPQNIKTMEWVEGEIGAKAFQMPPGWPANSPIPLWDSTDTVIYLKSVNQMGVPNQMQKLKYTIEDQPNPVILAKNQSGDISEQTEGNQYITKKDLEDFKKELLNSITPKYSNQNGGNVNRGGKV